MSLNEELEISERKKKLLALKNSINRKAKRSVVAFSSEAATPYFLRRPTGIMGLDVHLGGGWPAGGVSYLSGQDNCVDGDTPILVQTRRPDGTTATNKTLTIRRLYERFHDVPTKGKGRHVYEEYSRTQGWQLYAASMNEEHGIVQNLIVDVVKTGSQECFLLTTETGQEITATEEHKFFNGENYIPMKELRVGDEVFIHTNKVRRATQKKKAKSADRKFFNVKNHPTAYRKRIYCKKVEKEYFYHILPRSRAVVEAHMNQLPLKEYLQFLDDNHLENLQFLSSDDIVHHEDENTLNDELSNLLVTTRADHMREHLKDPYRDNMFRFEAYPTKVKSIKPVGKRETYDLKMAAPFHNYVANKMVVHNSGKTYLLFKTYAMHQRLYGKNACIVHAPVEGPCDYFFMRHCGYKVAIPMENIEQHQDHRRTRGVPLLTKEEVKELATGIGDFVLLMGANMEETLNQILSFTQEKIFHIVGVDSVSALCPSAEATIHDLSDFPQQGAHATLMKRFFQHYYSLVSGVGGINETTLLFTNQVITNRAKSEAPSYMAKYMKDWKPAGSAAAKHGKLIDVVIQSGSKEKEGRGGEKICVGKEVKWELLKGKAGTHDNLTGEFSYLYDQNCWELNAQNIITTGLSLGAVVEKGGMLSLIRPETGEPMAPLVNLPNFSAFVDALVHDKKLELMARYEILQAAKLACSYT